MAQKTKRRKPKGASGGSQRFYESSSRPRTTGGRILKALEGAPVNGLTQKEIQDRFKLSQTTVSGCLKSYLDIGVVIVAEHIPKRGGRNNAVVYIAATNKPEEATA